MKYKTVVHQFYCEVHDWIRRPFRITKAELKDASGWIACDICGEKCIQLQDLTIDVWRK